MDLFFVAKKMLKALSYHYHQAALLRTMPVAVKHSNMLT